MLLQKNSFIPFVTAGHPDLETTREVILRLASIGSAVIEIGIPFSDPIADGPIIQRSSFDALKHEYSMSDYIQLVKDVRAETDAGLIFMTYMNPVMCYGLEKLDRDASAAGLDGILISDLTPEEYGKDREVLITKCESSAPVSESGIPRFKNLQTVFLVAPTSTEERIEKICKATTGYVYLVARTGVTGEQTQVGVEIRNIVKEVRRFTELPVAVGFGIRSKSDVQRIWQFAEGAIVGSAIVGFIDENRYTSDLPNRVAQFVQKELLP